MTAYQEQPPGGGASTRPYEDVHEHLADELRRLDVLIRMRLARMDPTGPRNQLPRTVSVTAEEIAWLLAEQGPAARTDEDGALHESHNVLCRLTAEIDARTARCRSEGTELPLAALERLFGLSRQERDAVVVCLAPELRRSYDRLYAYLQDDITRQRPSVDLVLELLWPEEAARWAARGMFAETAPLLRYGILRTVDDPHSPSGSTGLSRFLALDPRICGFLLGERGADGTPLPRRTGPHRAAGRRLAGRAASATDVTDGSAPPGVGDPHGEEATAHGPLLLARRHLAADGPGRRPLVFHLYGPAASRPPELARWTGHRLGMPLLDLDLRAFDAPDATVHAVRSVLREGLLQDAAVHLAGADVLLHEDAGPLCAALSRAVADFGRLVFLTGERQWTGPPPFQGAEFQPFAVSPPDLRRSEALWREALRGHTADPDAWASDLANRFRLAPDLVSAAVERATAQRLMAPEPGPLTLADVSTACREQSRQRLGGLAVRVRCRARWEDLVMPEDRMGQLREICAQVRHRGQVHDAWGFGANLSRGTGLGVLFSGPPGTGKTMAAEVLARELDRDLYAVDLSGVVSKYIGETEKNLSRIFDEAQACDAVLFFDEADALYGRRTEVSDAHDRYANIETGYLLQRVESYEGIVVLATNLRQNMDEAFTRRMRFIVDFPFPEADSRARIWRTVFPPQAPLAPDIDFARLARTYPVTGGSIRNIAVNAAYLAAADGGAIGWRHVLRGTRTEFDKIGKLWPGPDLQHMSSTAGTPGGRPPASDPTGAPVAAAEEARP